MLQSHMARRASHVPCFLCQGTGQRWIAIKNSYGDEAGQIDRVRSLNRTETDDHEEKEGGINRPTASGSHNVPRATGESERKDASTHSSPRYFARASQILPMQQ